MKEINSLVRSRDDAKGLYKKLDEDGSEGGEPERLGASYTLGLWASYNSNNTADPDYSNNTQLRQLSLQLLQEAFLGSESGRDREYIGRNAAYGLSCCGRNGNREAIEFLIQCLSCNPSPTVRMNAAFALGEMGIAREGEVTTDDSSNTNNQSHSNSNTKSKNTNSSSLVGMDSVVSCLHQALTNKSEIDRVKVHAAEALGIVTQYCIPKGNNHFNPIAPFWCSSSNSRY